MSKEAKARIRINDLLIRSGWRFFSDDAGDVNVSLETHVKLTKKKLDSFGDDFEGTANGFIDYLLIDGKGFPVAVLEAKSEKHDPLVGKEQARKYAQSQNVRFVILSNGNLHYFWVLCSPESVYGLATKRHRGTQRRGGMENEKRSGNHEAMRRDSRDCIRSSPVSSSRSSGKGL
jgi:type I site-specific restriction endonuclease